ISFLSAELITLSGAIGVIFGSNIGTTTTAWIVSTFGVKINIAHLAMPMLIFGVILRFNKLKTYQGLANILIGLGFVFLGISFMKDGFETLKDGIHLADYAMDGWLGVLVYVLIGAIATIVIQSSSATMAIIITALATGQILYFNALELAIGANIGTTVTAVIGALASNENGKRLAVAHFIFNAVTGLIAIVFLYQLAELVTYLSSIIGIAEDDYAMQLALFHTIFNIIGVIVMSPFTYKLVSYLETLFIPTNDDISRARYLDKEVIQVPQAAVEALKKEVSHLYDNASEAISHALSLHRHTYIGMGSDINEVVKASVTKIDIDIDNFYEKKIKVLYGDIIKFATLSQEAMSIEDKDKVHNLKIACRDIVEAIKDVEVLQKNINKFMKSKNENVIHEYNHIRKTIAQTLDGIYTLRNKKGDDDLEVLTKIKMIQSNLDELDMLKNGRIDALIRNDSIDTKIATSLINDSTYGYEISKKLIHAATELWIENKEIKDLGEK
ncbi:MAG: Na/Pi cotransporter family protein, partial [Campylobacterales bacterium]|nr:Na/Pi cotransporter family protein [Campylobacterales bacterium]